jgi:hypothetical protein
MQHAVDLTGLPIEARRVLVLACSICSFDAPPLKADQPLLYSERAACSSWLSPTFATNLSALISLVVGSMSVGEG